MSASLLICLALLLPIDAFRFHGSELYEGDPCEMEDGSIGECSRITNCKMRIREVQVGIRATSLKGHCGFDGFAEIVCCPKQKEPQSSTPPPSITNRPPTTIPNFIIESIATSSTEKSAETVEISPATEMATILNYVKESDSTINYTTSVGTLTSEASYTSMDEATETIIDQTIEPAAEINSLPISKTTITTISQMEIQTSTVASRITEMMETNGEVDTTNINDDRINIQSTETAINQTTEPTADTSGPLMEETTLVASSTVEGTSPLIELLSSTLASRITETTANAITMPTTTISNSLNEVRPAELACNEYKTGFLDKDGKIIFLMPISISETILNYEEFPFIAALGYKMKKDNSKLIQYRCGGTLISTQHILTAAHCVSNADKNVPVEVRLGYPDISSINVQIIPVGEIMVHPRYKIGSIYHNIAVIKLSSAVIISQQIMPICLQYISIPKSTISVDISRIITGWGVRREESNNLSKVPSLRLIDEPKCMEFYDNSTTPAEGGDESIICLQDENIMKSTELLCQSDNSSGIPLIQVDKNSINVVGIELSSQNCGNNIPGVYVNIFKYIDWIEDVVWPKMQLSVKAMANPEIDVRMNI